MFPNNPTFESDIRREDMLREARKLRLIREAQQADTKSRPSMKNVRRTLAALLSVNPR
jgi:hypothetical protein